MGTECSNPSNFDGANVQYRRVLMLVIVINVLMFVVELSFGIVGQSQALKADALDFLGDSTTYAMSLWAIGRSLQTRANVAMIKGVSLLLLAFWVFASSFYYMFVSNSPSAPIMISVAIAALTANMISVLLLIKFRNGDANIRSVWLCSRNDAIGNVLVLVAAAIVLVSHSRWPDLIVAVILAALFANSAIKIIVQARHERRESSAINENETSA